MYMGQITSLFVLAKSSWFHGGFINSINISLFLHPLTNCCGKLNPWMLWVSFSCRNIWFSSVRIRSGEPVRWQCSFIGWYFIWTEVIVEIVRCQIFIFFSSFLFHFFFYFINWQNKFPKIVSKYGLLISWIVRVVSWRQENLGSEKRCKTILFCNQSADPQHFLWRFFCFC